MSATTEERLARLEALVEGIAGELALPRLARERLDAASRAANEGRVQCALEEEKAAALQLATLKANLPRLWGDRDPPAK